MKRPLNPLVFCLTVLPLLIAGSAAVYWGLADAAAGYRYGAVLLLAYLIGSVPWGYLLLNWTRGEDVRDYGSGRTGMTNVLRTGGGKMAALVLVLDLGKGVAVVVLARAVLYDTLGEVGAGLLALAGHNWPVFLGFRGGRGVAVGLGGLSIMAPFAAVMATIVFLPVALLSRYLSLGSITGVVIAFGSLLGLSLVGIYPFSYTWYGLIGGAVIIWQHRDNIQRLIQGTERRLGAPATRIS